MLCLEPNAGILPLAIEFMLRKSQKLSLSLEIILLNKTSKYRELVFATELISGDVPKLFDKGTRAMLTSWLAY